MIAGFIGRTVWNTSPAMTTMSGASAITRSMARRNAWAQPPAAVTLDEAAKMVARSPRVLAAERDADMARAERATAGALPNPTVSFGSARPGGGERTIFDANSQQQATIEQPIPIFSRQRAGGTPSQVRKARTKEFPSS